MKILIIEDEEAAVKRLKKSLQAIDPAIEVVGELDSVEASLQWLENEEDPDLILMDIHLADGSSFEIFDLTQIQCPVIFTTAYDEYAIQAFRVNAVDYLLKPIKQSELQAAIEKYRRITQAPMDRIYKVAEAIQDQQAPRRLLIRIGQTIKLVDLDEAAYFYTESKVSFVCTKEGKRYPVDYSLEKLEGMLDPQKFFRVNRQFIVNIDAIEKMYTYSKSRVKILLDPPVDTDVIVSTERSSNFKKWLTGNLEDK